MDDWIEEIQNVMKSRHMNKEETIDFIYSHLTGSAKEEIRYRSNKERRDPTKVLRILSEAFGEKQGITVIQRFSLTENRGRENLFVNIVTPF